MRPAGDFIGAEALTMGHSATGGLIDFLAAIDGLRPAFMKDALCREPRYAGVDFFPPRGASTEPAKAVCRRCIVADECRAYAGEDPNGVWGGTSGRERRQPALAVWFVRERTSADHFRQRR